MKKVFKYFLLPLFCFLMLSTHCLAQESADKAPPLWEFGLFNAAACLPHYRGSDEYQWYALPLPYFIYRGEFIQSDRDGVRGIFSRTRNFELDVSLSGNPPVSGDNDTREGMSGLDALFEIGPALKWFFMGRNPFHTLYLQTAVRCAASVGFDSGVDIEYQGIHSGVNLLYHNSGHENQADPRRVRFGLQLGIDFADSRLNSYFYDVPKADALPDRTFYESDGGYAGASVSASLQKPITPSLSLGGYFRWENISGAVFEDSPLVRKKNNFVIGCALTWKIFESERPARSLP